MENTLVRSRPCPECGGTMLWSQNAWEDEGVHAAAYRCAEGHVVNPRTTRQCPGCGVHDTAELSDEGGSQEFSCLRCGREFRVPR